MSTTFEAAAAAINKAAEAFGSAPARKHRSEWRQPYAAGLRFVLLDLIGDGDWKELSRLAADVRKDATHDLKQMSRQQDDLRRMAHGLDIARDQVADKWHAPNTFSEWVAKQDSFVEELVQQGMERDRAIEAVRELGQASARDVLRNIEKPLTAWQLELENCTVGRLAALSAADLSDAIATFNRHATDPQEEHVTTSAVSSRVRGHFRELYDELKRDDDQQLEGRANGIETEIDEILEPLLRAAAFIAGPIGSSSNAGHGRTGIAIADAIHSCLLLRSAARVIAWTSGWGKGSALLGQWRTAAREKTFASTLVAPQVERLSDLAASSPADGQRISVEGWMGPITISHHGRKALSTATMTDRAGHTLQVGLPYIKLDSGGIVANTYARFVGNFYREHHDFVGHVFVPARRSLTQDSHHSWMDWLTLKLMPVATPVAHNLAAHWNWAPGPDGAGNPLRYGTWASTRKGLH